MFKETWSYGAFRGCRWNNGKCEEYGMGKLKNNTEVVVTLNVTNGNLSFETNGVSQGIAFRLPQGTYRMVVQIGGYKDDSVKIESEQIIFKRVKNR